MASKHHLDSTELLWDSFLKAQPETCSLGLLWIFTVPGIGVVLHNFDFNGNSDFISVDLPCQKYKNKAMHLEVRSTSLQKKYCTYKTFNSLYHGPLASS